MITTFTLNLYSCLFNSHQFLKSRYTLHAPVSPNKLVPSHLSLVPLDASAMRSFLWSCCLEFWFWGFVNKLPNSLWYQLFFFSLPSFLSLTNVVLYFLHFLPCVEFAPALFSSRLLQYPDLTPCFFFLFRLFFLER